jgi:hypothetical protein
MHPVLEKIPDSGSVTLQVTTTGTVLFQPAAFGRGVTVGTITGGVVSTMLVTARTGNAPAGLVVNIAVLPAASTSWTKATVQFPVSLPAGIVTIAVPVNVGLAAKEMERPAEKVPEGLIKPTEKPVTPETCGGGSEAENPTATFAEEDATLTIGGEKVRLPVKMGGVVSGVADKVIVVAKPWVAISAVVKTCVFPATSTITTLVIVHAPASLNLGKVTVAVQFVTSPAGQPVVTFTV